MNSIRHTTLKRFFSIKTKNSVHPYSVVAESERATERAIVAEDQLAILQAKMREMEKKNVAQEDDDDEDGDEGEDEDGLG